MNPIEKYNSRAKKINSLVCVGLDCDFAKIPQNFKEQFKAKEFPQFEFNKYIIDHTHPFAAAYKPNSAFYEARGEQGIKELKMTMEYLIENHSDIFTILDAKRADIGNTNMGYVEAIFDWLGFDAVTLHPYLGHEAIAPFLDRADKCSIILARTSNPGAPEFQDQILKDTGAPLWQDVARRVSQEWNKNKNLMIVVGGTYPEELAKAREITGDMTFLVPGIGAQGGEVKNIISRGKNSQGLGLIINSARQIIFSANPAQEAEKLREEINANK